MQPCSGLFFCQGVKYLENYLAVLIFAFSTAITPGPNNLMVMSSGLNYGIERSVPHLLGACTSLALMVLFIGLGLGAIFETYPAIHLFIKIMGIIYLLYLAWRIAMVSGLGVADSNKRPFTFIQAAAFQWVNPKAWVVFIGAIAAFTNPESNLVPQITFIAVTLLVAGFVSLNIWLWLGTRMEPFIQKESHRRYFNISMAVLLVLSIVPMALSEIG